jgi:hypothetical protein
VYYHQGDGSIKPTFLRHDHRFTAQPDDIETKFGLDEAEEGLISLGWLGCDIIEI